MGLTIIDNSNIFQKDVIGNVRTAQEDSHDIAVCTPNGDVFVVCDGMGGHVGGKQASSIAVKSIIDYLKREKYGNPIQALNDALQFANLQILGYASEHPDLKGMGTTACILLLQNSEAYIAHVGDSRIYLYLGKEKQLHRITKDHSFVQALVDAGQITDVEAEHHPNKNRILKALGIKPDLSPSIDQVHPKNGDVFIICSDGLSGMVPDAKIREVLMQNESIENKGETLINLALTAGGLDNITLELIQIVSSPHTKSVFKSYNPNADNGESEGPRNVLKKLIIAFSALLLCVLVGIGLCRLIRDRHNDSQQKEIIRSLSTEIMARQNDSITISNEIVNKLEEFQPLIIKAEDAEKNNYETAPRYKESVNKIEKEIDSLKQLQSENNTNLMRLRDSLYRIIKRNQNEGNNNRSKR